MQTQRTDAVEVLETLAAVGSSTDAAGTGLERQTATRPSSADQTLQQTAAADIGRAAAATAAAAAPTTTSALQPEKPRPDALHESAVNSELCLAVARADD